MKSWTLVGSAVVLAGIVAFAQEKPKEPKADEHHVPRHGVAVLVPTAANLAKGTIHFTMDDKGVRVHGKVSGLTPGKHGFHIHEFGDLRSKDGKAAGGHYNPENAKHGGPDDKDHHAGDLGNIEAGADGVAEVDRHVRGLKLHFVVGRSIVVHSGADDLKSQPAGDSGDRVAVGVIGIANPEWRTDNPSTATSSR